MLYIYIFIIFFSSFRYYYAVVECDSPFTAKIICQTCDGNEYESSANFFDIRYIPDDMTFDDDVPRDTCTHVADNYKPVKFSTEALQHTKVKLTWDQDEPERIELTRRDFTEQDLKDLDFEAYLASSSSEDDDDDENDDSLEKIRAKYRKLLQETNENVYDDKDMENGNSDNDGDMEITFTPGLSELAATKLNQNDDGDDNEEEKEETSIEKYMRKQKEKRLAKKERRENKWKEENVSSTTDKNDKKKINNDMLESDTDEELEQDDYFKEARQEMEQELSLDKKKGEQRQK